MDRWGSLMKESLEMLLKSTDIGKPEATLNESARIRQGWWSRTLRGATCAVLASVAAISGCTAPKCILSTRNAIPAYRLPDEFKSCSHGGKVPIDLSLLGQRRSSEHIIGAGDVLGVYIAGVLPPKIDDAPIVYQGGSSLNRQYYPPNGDIEGPSIGVPLEVQQSGNVRFPLIGKVDLAGYTIEEAADTVRNRFEEAGVIQAGRERVLLTLLRSRVSRVLVIRDDSPGISIPIRKDGIPFTKTGRGEIVDLPPNQNDVLHALTSSGGMPGIDTYSEVWIFRRRETQLADIGPLQQQVAGAESAQSLVQSWAAEERHIIRIPLRVHPEEPISIAEDDVILEEGDVLYLHPRDEDYFYTGGLLQGGKIPLPRDQDLDILEAIGYANGAVGGPGAIGAVFRTGPGNVYPPSQALIVRKLPNGQQISIRCDLNRAVHNPNERILIMADDQVYLFYKPSEFYGNLFLNYVGANITFIPGQN
jgi:protein involved in polysaccharide export with SLBB domain